MAMPVIVRLARRRPDAAALLVVPAAFNVLLPIVRGQGVYPRTFIFGLAVGYFFLIEALDYLLARKPALAWVLTGVIAAGSFAQLVPYYRLPKQGFAQALAFVDANRAAADRRVGLTLAGKAVRFYDPSFELVENTAQILERTGDAAAPIWVISTFAGQMRADDPAVYEWLMRDTEPRAEFPGVIGDGTVHVSYWAPRLGQRGER